MVLRSSTSSRFSNAAAILEDPLPANRPQKYPRFGRKRGIRLPQGSDHLESVPRGGDFL
jgi:hypothetical protein